MLIIKEAKKAPHINPTLRVGHVYQLVSDAGRSGSYFKAGDVFVYGNNEIVWLATPTGGGGYDRQGVVEDRGLQFQEINLYTA